MAAFCAAALSVPRTLRQPASKPSIVMDSAASGPQSVIGGFRTAAIANGSSAKYPGVIPIGPTIEVLAVQTVKYRLFEPRLAPRRTKLEVPGWGGNSEPRSDGSHEQAWHCMPFNEGAQYGIELCYPFDNELHVTKQKGQVVLEGDFGPDPMTGIQWPPFRTFGEGYYTYQLLLDLEVADDMAIRTEPHPRFYTSAQDDVPIAVPALLRTSWWPMISFVVFKAPPEGRTHIFRPDEPFMQILFLPAEPHFTLLPMDEEEAAQREMRYRRIHASRDTLGKESAWISSTNTVFDATYRNILRAARVKARKTPS
jgi:hypothetical protein